MTPLSDGQLAALIVENAREYAIFTMDAAGNITSWSAGAENVLGFAREEIVGENFAVLFTASDRAAGSDKQELAVALEAGRAEDTRWHLRKDGERFWANGMTMRIADSDPPMLLKILRDETPAKLAEEQRVLLLNELNHRIKNTLAIIQSITEQTLRAENVDASSRALLTERLLALSQAHNVLTDENWAGADLGTMANQVLAPLSSLTPARVRIEGPRVRLNPHQAVAMALVLHELGTNALKYGALSNEAGQVLVAWNLAHSGAGDRHITLLWEETGGPEVKPPSREGFGTRVIRRSFPQQSGGTARLEYRPTGLTCVFEVPLADGSDVAEPPAAPYFSAD